MQMTPRRLHGKVAIVTGASRGIGRAIAVRYAEEGAAVVVNYLADADAADELARTIESAGGRASAVQADVSNKDEVEALVRAAHDRFGSVDILVNNAGINRPTELEGITDELFDDLVGVNVRGLLYCAQAVMPSMKERRKGKIVNLSSVAAFGTALPGNTPYAATKAAIVALTKRLAFEAGPYGINVNALCPGVIRTDATAGSDPSSPLALDVMAKRAMLGRIGEPEEIAAAALFLASDESAFMTAQAMTVDGGRMDFLSHSG